MEKYSSAPLKLAIFALLLLAISGPSLARIPEGSIIGSDEQAALSSDATLRDAIKELAKEKLDLLKAYERVFVAAMAKKQEVGKETTGNQLKCYGGGYPCNSYSECCSQECYMGTCL